MASLEKEINGLVSNLPEVKGILETNSDYKREVVLVVDDVLTWHKENVVINPRYYGVLGKKMIDTASNSYELTGENFYTKNKDIRVGKKKIDIITVSENDFDVNLTTWNSLALANRFHRGYNIVKGTEVIERAINSNLESMIRYALYFMNDGDDIFDLYASILTIEFIGTNRVFDLMNLIDENFIYFTSVLKDEKHIFRNTEDSIFDYFKVTGSGRVIVDQEKLMNNTFKLPAFLSRFLLDYGIYSFNDLRQL